MFVDFKPLNNNMVKQKFPIPQIDGLHDLLQDPEVYMHYLLSVKAPGKLQRQANRDSWS